MRSEARTCRNGRPGRWTGGIHRAVTDRPCADDIMSGRDRAHTAWIFASCCSPAAAAPGALAELLGADARVALTVAINGYDDGASTGEVRRFLGDALGPSDFRKNASRFARASPDLRRRADRPARSPPAGWRDRRGPPRADRALEAGAARRPAGLDPRPCARAWRPGSGASTRNTGAPGRPIDFRRRERRQFRVRGRLPRVRPPVQRRRRRLLRPRSACRPA